MDIPLDKVCDLIIRAKALDMKDPDVDPDSGSNPIDDGNLDSLVLDADDQTEAELREVIAGLNEDERLNLVALVFIGRGDLEPEEWAAAVRMARDRETSHGADVADWLLGIPNLGDLLDEGLTLMGRSCV